MDCLSGKSIYKELHAQPSAVRNFRVELWFHSRQFSTQGAKVNRAAVLSSGSRQFWREVGTFILMAIEGVGVPCNRAVFLFLVFSVVMAGSSLSLGQVAPRWEVFGGYAYRNVDSTTFGFVNRSSLSGFDAEGTFNIKPNWGVTADVGGQYGSQLTVYNFLAGPQYSIRRDKSKFFVHGLFGKAQDRVNIATSIRSHFESVGRAIGGGGGYDLDLTRRFTFRVQADYLDTHTFGVTQNDIRVSTGLVFHFGQIGHRPKL